MAAGVVTAMAWWGCGAVGRTDDGDHTSRDDAARLEWRSGGAVRPGAGEVGVGHHIAADAKLAGWRAGTVRERLDRRDLDAVEADRQVLAVVGITGSGKSSTSNTLAGRTFKPFALSNALTSVTRAVAFRDYTFMDIPWRVIDTPGLFDTNRSDDETREELARFATLAPHGVTAFIFVVQRGRFTNEQERAMRELTRLFGPGVAHHSIIAITAATDPGEGRQLMTRDALVEEINGLPLDHFFRRFVQAAGWRVVPVENHLDPHRQISRMALHQRVLDVLRDTDGQRYDCSNIRVRADGGGAAPGHDASGESPPTPSTPPGRRHGAALPPATSLSVSKCTQRVSQVEHAAGLDNRRRGVLEIRCDVEW